MLHLRYITEDSYDNFNDFVNRHNLHRAAMEYIATFVSKNDIAEVLPGWAAKVVRKMTTQQLRALGGARSTAKTDLRYDIYRVILEVDNEILDQMIQTSTVFDDTKTYYVDHRYDDDSFTVHIIRVTPEDKATAIACVAQWIKQYKITAEDMIEEVL